jgi:CRP-like cAMP-binding protein
MARRIEAGVFIELSTVPGPFHRMLLRYTQAFLTQVAQTAACNGAHLVDERCARWLLMTHDRVDGNEFRLTHEFLAFMLGVRRAGVTVAMRALQDARLISYTRGKVTVVDRSGLERKSCECYAVVRAHFERLLPHHA